MQNNRKTHASFKTVKPCRHIAGGKCCGFAFRFLAGILAHAVGIGGPFFDTQLAACRRRQRFAHGFAFAGGITTSSPAPFCLYTTHIASRNLGAGLLHGCREGNVYCCSFPQNHSATRMFWNRWRFWVTCVDLKPCEGQF